MHALRLRGSLHRAVRVSTRAYAAALPGYPTPGTAFSPPPAPTRVTEETQPPTSARTAIGSSALPSSLGAKTSATLPKTDIPIFTSLADLRSWRDKAFRDGKTVGFVPTMGALHDGHITLVRESLKENELTVVSIYVNPAQFAPHEDLATYPRTLDSDVSLLSKLHPSTTSPPVAVFLPSTSEMYPSGLSHSTQLGTYVLPPPNLASQMEGKSRPTFFRGVATVVTKLLNAVLPTRVYFGQKDIQQALLMRGMVRDLCMGVRVRVVKTVREEVVTSGAVGKEGSEEQVEGLALSSRNAYLSAQERAVAPTLRRALEAVKAAWYAGASRADALAAGRAVVDEVAARADGVSMRLDYIEMNDPVTFEVVPDETRAGGEQGPAVILSGALWVGRTRLIDNVLLGDAGWVFE